MKSTTTLGELAKALVKVQSQLQPAKKDANNPFFNSRYADLNSVWDSCRDLLAKNGLSVVQINKPTEQGITIETVLLHESGEWVSGSLYLPGEQVDKKGNVKFNAQTMGSAMTYGRRYGLAAILGIVSDEDEDGNAASQPKAQSVKPAEKSTKPKMWNNMLAQQHEGILKLAEMKGIDDIEAVATDAANKFLAEMNEEEAGKFIKLIGGM